MIYQIIREHLDRCKVTKTDNQFNETFGVLPALFPDDLILDYHNLTGGVQNGGDAMTIFPKIKDMPPDEAKAAREALLRYCELDTWAMVKVWEKLKEVAK